MKRIEHLGIAVKDLDESVKIYTALLGKEAYKYEEVKSESVKTAFFQVGESKIELLQATDPSSAIAKYLEKNKNGFHHVAFEVEDIEEEISRLVSEGFQMIHKEPKDGADNKRIAFLHPKSSDGLLVEICQEKIS
jgi:methylmalonyl-CoA/ethylmalonyl-CoA epimerase